MNTSNASLPSSVWLLVAAFALGTLLLLLVRSKFGPPMPFSLFAFGALVLGLSALTVIRSASDFGALWQTSSSWGLLCTAVIMARLVVDSLAPRDVVEAFLTQSRGDFPELNDPRRWLLGLAVATIFLAAGLRGAWRTGDVRRGIVAAMATSLIGALLTLALVALGTTQSVNIRGEVAAAFAMRRGGMPMAPLVLLLISTVLGTIGAMFGRGLGGILREKTSTT